MLPHCNWAANRKTNLDLLDAIGARVGALRDPWIIGGDCNCTPEDLTATGWLQKVRGVIHAPSAPTCNGKVYDFFVVERELSNAVYGVHTIGDFPPRL